MGTLIQDIKYGIRVLAKNSGSTVVAVLTLALGIGENTAIFSVLSAVWLRPLPFKNPDRIVYLWASNLTIGLDKGLPSPADFADWRDQNRVFEHISAWRTWF
jgi:putative ABC transport system permease protein